MPFVIQRHGYIISPYFDYLSFLFDRRWRHPAGGVLGLMIKPADSAEGRVEPRRGSLEKELTGEDRKRLAEAEALCRKILVDFGVVKAHVAQVMNRLDHKFLNELEYFSDGNPSSENIARYVADSLREMISVPGLRVSRVTAWESDDAAATYIVPA